MKRLLLLLSLLLLQPLLNAEGQKQLEQEQLEQEQLEQGAERYRFHCAACHGPQGGGLAEARLAFPEDHRRCERCHKPNNPPQMSLDIITPRSAFNIGTAPDLHGLERFGTALGLYTYVRAAMPRQEPGNLSDDDYLAITAFLLSLNDLLPEGFILEEESAGRGSLNP